MFKGMSFTHSLQKFYLMIGIHFVIIYSFVKLNKNILEVYTFFFNGANFDNV